MRYLGKKYWNVPISRLRVIPVNLFIVILFSFIYLWMSYIYIYQQMACCSGTHGCHGLSVHRHVILAPDLGLKYAKRSPQICPARMRWGLKSWITHLVMFISYWFFCMKFEFFLNGLYLLIVGENEMGLCAKCAIHYVFGFSMSQTASQYHYIAHRSWIMKLD